MFNNMKLVHWPLMGGLLHLVQRGVVFGARAWNFKLLVSGSPSSRSHGAEILEILVDVECMGVWKITIFDQYLALSLKRCKIEP